MSKITEKLNRVYQAEDPNKQLLIEEEKLKTELTKIYTLTSLAIDQLKIDDLITVRKCLINIKAII